MEVWVDKLGGRHYHLKICSMVKDPMYNYEPIEKRIRKYKLGFGDIKHDGKFYMPCPGCFGKRRMAEGASEK